MCCSSFYSKERLTLFWDKRKTFFAFRLERDCLFRVVAIWQMRNNIFIKSLFILFQWLWDQSSYFYFECLDNRLHLYKSFFIQKILTYNLPMATILNRWSLSMLYALWEYKRTFLVFFHWLICLQFWKIIWIFNRVEIFVFKLSLRKIRVSVNLELTHNCKHWWLLFNLSV